MANQEQRASLACTEGRSDKVYFTQLVQSGDGWLVLAQYGPRGGVLKSADKHPTPVPYAVALKAFESLVKSKVAKGYVPSDAEGGAAAACAPTATFTDIRPQLLTPIEERDLTIFLHDPAFIAQIKHDGERRLLVVDVDAIYGTNRKGQRITLSQAIATDALQLAVPRDGRTILDGEQIGDCLYVWDILERDGANLRTTPLRQRQVALSALLEGLGENASIRPVESAASYDAKCTLLERVRQQGLEGVVFKHATSRYIEGRPASGGDWRKYKLTASATVRVAGHTPGKRSVALEVIDRGVWRDVGNVTIPANHDVPEIGALCEVEYLYVANVGGCLFQPVYKGVRFDQDENDCDASQLKYKGALHAA